MICTFGVPSAVAKRHVALIGDSHAGKWRTGMTKIAEKLKWSVSTTTLLGCPFSTVTSPKPGLTTEDGLKWKRAIPRWLASRPEIDTLFVAQLAHPFTTQATFDADVAGFQQQWGLLPPTIKHIVVFRDNPKARNYTLDCVERAITDRRPAGTACALPRARVMDGYPDTAAAAALQLNRPNVGVVDLTKIYCDSKLCYPVIGGLLVTSDKSHLTPIFNGTLVPYVLDALNRGKWLDR